jgi:ribonuclease VapC
VIVVDTSALMAIVLNEPEADDCESALAQGGELLISAGTLAEALLVSGRRGLSDGLERLIGGLAFEVAPVDARMARLVADAYGTWGRGGGRASLNFGDCFAYALAKDRDCSLLYVGEDFSRTDALQAR